MMLVQKTIFVGLLAHHILNSLVLNWCYVKYSSFFWNKNKNNSADLTDFVVMTFQPNIGRNKPD